MKVATIILNRNLPAVTDNLYNHLMVNDGDITDIFVVEAGSDAFNLSKNTSWYVNSNEVLAYGLRYCRGMNYGLVQLIKEGKFNKYDAFFLLTNDTELDDGPTLVKLLSVLSSHPKVAILSPCSKNWGEYQLLLDIKTKYFWFIHNNSYLVRRKFIEDICNLDKPDYLNFLFDGSNFRGYGSEHELIAKAYANDWAAAITSVVTSRENESYLLNEYNKIKTENYHENIDLYISEGLKWMKYKYGFTSHWTMQQYVKSFYDKFFEFNPEFINYKI